MLGRRAPVAAVGRHKQSIRDAADVRVHIVVRRRIGRDAAAPVVVAMIVLVGSVLSVAPDAVPASAAVGWTLGEGTAPRIAVGGQGTVLGPYDSAREPIAGPNAPPFRALDPAALAMEEEPVITPGPALDGAFLEDGTLVKPATVDTSVADGKSLLRSYTVEKGDTLVRIAEAHGVSMMTVWWANKLSSKEVVEGQVLTIPPVNGLVITVKEGDTLDSVSTKYNISADEIYDTNGLEDRALVIGQTLILPGAAGAPIATPNPVVRPSTQSAGRISGPPTYTSGAFAWPVLGGGNYVSQYFRSGHYGLDIAANYGSTVTAAGAGTVVFAGWKDNCGGYQVWIAHGSGLYTTYNHMSSVTVGAGQSVGRGQQVGGIGSSGCVTGPHVHFEVWRGAIWNGGNRVNPLPFF